MRRTVGLGIFGDDEDDLNEALLQVSAEFESKIMPRATAPSLALAPSRVRGSGLQHAPSTATKPTSSY